MVLLICGFCISTSQRKMGAFLNGYSVNCNGGWAQSNAPNLSTPNQLVAEGILDGNIVPCLPSLNPSGPFNSAFSSAFSVNQSADRWVIVGHSLGGLIAHLGDAASSSTVRQLLNSAGVQLKGIATIGTPHRGVPAAANLPAASAAITNFSNDILAGPQYYQTYGGGIIDVILTQLNNGRPYYDVLATTLADARTNIEALSQSSIADYIAPNSPFINTLNNIPIQTPHVSISGVENSPALVRWLPTLGFGSGLAASPDEYAVINQYNQAKNTYSSVSDYHMIMRDFWYWEYWMCWWNCDYERDQYYYHKDARDAWGRGWWALNGIDDTWFTIHNEYLSATGSYTYWVPCEGGLPKSGLAPGPLQEYDPCQYGAGGYWETVTYTYNYADQSDGFIPKNRTKWTGNDFAQNPGSLGSAQHSNVSFDGSGEADGGYNNGEMRDLARRYGQHQASKPMQYGKDWIQFWIVHN